MRKRVWSLLLVLVMIPGLVGCGNGEGAERQTQPEHIEPTGIMVPVADYQDVGVTLSDANLPFSWCGDSFVFLQREWDKEAGMNLCTLWRAPADGMSEPEVFYESTTEQPSIWCFTTDGEENIYTLDWVPLGTDRTWSLHKYDRDMQELQGQELDSGDFPVRLNYVNDILVDCQGNVVLLDYVNTRVYLFDSQLQYLGQSEASVWMQEDCFVDGGEQGSFIWDFDNTTGMLGMQKINFEKGCLEDPVNYDVEAYAGVTMVMVSGYENGTLISSNHKLWKFDPASGTAEEWIDWQDPNVNIEGNHVRKIIFGQEGEEELPVLKVLCHDYLGDNPSISEVHFVDQAYAPHKETIVLGAFVSYATEEWVRNFNRTSQDYEVELRIYDDLNAFTEELLFNQEMIPDIIDVSWNSVDMLDGKGLLEDLTPYFEKSEVVGKEDILEQIWEMCEKDGKVTSMMISFYFQSCVTTAEGISEDGWTYDEFFALQEKYPESTPLLYFSESNVWGMLGGSGVAEFIDWENKTCSFDSDAFRALMEKVSSLDYGTGEMGNYQEDEEVAKLLRQEYLVRRDYYNTPYWYRRAQKKYQHKISNVGFPTQDGTPYYYVYPRLQLAVYSGSENKDGAWAFIEYLLSKESQTWYGSDINAFPVRAAEFDAFLTKPESPVVTYADDDLSVDTYTVFTRMIENSHLAARNMGEISSIINEELQAYYENAKTAEETSKIIQNRVQLYLDENF